MSYIRSYWQNQQLCLIQHLKFIRLSCFFNLFKTQIQKIPHQCYIIGNLTATANLKMYCRFQDLIKQTYLTSPAAGIKRLMQFTVTHLDNEKDRRNSSYQLATIKKPGLSKYLAEVF